MKITKYKNFIKEARIEDQESFPSNWKSKITNKAREDGNVIKRSSGFVNPMSVMSLVHQMYDMQNGHEEELTELALEVIKNYYGNIIENVEIDAKIVNPKTTSKHLNKTINDVDTKNFKDRPSDEDKESIEDEYDVEFPDGFQEYEIDKDLLKAEINKRKISNMFMQGQAKTSHRIIHEESIREKINDIKPGLMELYDKLMKSNELAEWDMPEEMWLRYMTSMPDSLGGFEKVAFKKTKKEKPESDIDDLLNSLEDGEDGENSEEIEDVLSNGQPIIIARADCFPVLIHEVVKGIYELIATAGIPKDMYVAGNVMSETDTLQDEVEDLKFGPYFKDELFAFMYASKVKDLNIIKNLDAFVFGHMMQMEAKEFVIFVKGILENTSTSRKIMDSIISDIVDEEKEYQKSLQYSEEEQEEPENIFEPEKEENVDYSKMSQSQLQKIANDALENDDFKTLDVVGKFLKESLRNKYKRKYKI